MNIDRFILHLSLISGVGIETIRKLVSLLDEYSIQDMYSFSAQNLTEIMHCSEKKSSIIIQGLANKALLEKEEKLIEQSKAYYISMYHPDYPQFLCEIHSPPPILYYKGRHFSDYKNQNLIAIVGSRQGNYYAQQVINHFIPELVKQNVDIVSGGALGVDSMAHKATIQAGGKTIVVLGSGLLHLYPYQNKSLFDAIIENKGTIITPFSMATQPTAHNFPARNRIISGMSSKTIVIQAAAKSGAYITAQCALEQGRDVFAVPGNIFEPLSAGCHTLLSEGAQLADNVETIVGKNLILDKTAQLENQQAETFKQKNAPIPNTITDIILSQCRTPKFLEELSELIDTIDIIHLQKELLFQFIFFSFQFQF